MSAAFTPGPWRAAGFSSIVGVPVCAQPDKTKNTFNVCGVAAPVSREENIANGHLIAASPELYAFTDAALDQLEVLHSTLPSGDARAAVWRVILAGRAALAKARGES